MRGVRNFSLGIARAHVRHRTQDLKLKVSLLVSRRQLGRTDRQGSEAPSETTSILWPMPPPRGPCRHRAPRHAVGLLAIFALLDGPVPRDPGSEGYYAAWGGRGELMSLTTAAWVSLECSPGLGSRPTAPFHAPGVVTAETSASGLSHHSGWGPQGEEG